MDIPGMTTENDGGKTKVTGKDRGATFYQGKSGIIMTLSGKGSGRQRKGTLPPRTTTKGAMRRARQWVGQGKKPIFVNNHA